MPIPLLACCRHMKFKNQTLPTLVEMNALNCRLSNDIGIRAIMADHMWKVGLLSEMPPEGKVGVSAMCVLGYNVNHGQEISLRLRTDDLRGEIVHTTRCYAQ